MSSNYFGELGSGRGRSSTPSRKWKKSTPEKPKQPQRGLGVAQLEKMRLQDQMAEYLPSPHPPFFSNLRMENMKVDTAAPPPPSNLASSSSGFAFHPNAMMGYGDTERRNTVDGEFHSRPPSSTLPPHRYAPATVTRLHVEESTENSVHKKQRYDQRHSTGSISPNSDSSDTKEVDLELRLSL